MSKIKKHPVLEVPVWDKVIFKYNGQEVEGEKGYTIAAALHRAGFPVHSHSLDGRERSLECGIGKCGAIVYPFSPSTSCPRSEEHTSELQSPS